MKRKTEKEWKSRAEKQAEKERKRQIKEANRMLISTPKKTVASMGFLSFDPAGAFCFEGSRWIKIYRVTGSIAESVKVVLEIKSRLRITERIVPTNGGSAEENYYISLIAQGDIYEEIRKQFESDERILREMIGVQPLSVDEAVTAILMQFQGENRTFSYASFVRSKRDLSKELFTVMEEGRDCFQIEGSFGMSLFLMEYPESVMGETLSLLKELGCLVFVTFDLVAIGELDKEDYVRTLEKKYARPLNRDAISEFMNVSGQISFLCDSTDAMEIIKKTISKIFAKSGFLAAPAYGAQRDCFLSQISLGLIDYRNLRNVDVATMDEVFRREYGSD